MCTFLFGKFSLLWNLSQIFTWVCIVTLSIQALKLHFGNYSSPAWVQCCSWGTLLFPCCFEQTCNLHVCTVLKVARCGLGVKLAGIYITCNLHEHIMLCFLALSLSLSLFFFPFFWVPAGCASFGLSLAFPFCLPCDGFSHRSFIGPLASCFLDSSTDCSWLGWLCWHLLPLEMSFAWTLHYNFRTFFL